MEKEMIDPMDPAAVDGKSMPSLLELAASNANFSIVYAAVSSQPDIMKILESDGPFTVFAPNNAAFEKFLVVNNLSAEEALQLPTVPEILKARAPVQTHGKRRTRCSCRWFS